MGQNIQGRILHSNGTTLADTHASLEKNNSIFHELSTSNPVSTAMSSVVYRIKPHKRFLTSPDGPMEKECKRRKSLRS